MAILFGGGEIGAFLPSDSNCHEDTRAVYNAAFARCGLLAQGNASYNETPTFATSTDIWFHFDTQQATPTSSSSLDTICTMLNPSGVEVFRLQSSSVDPQTWQLQYLLSSTWTNLGASFTTAAAAQTIDIHLVCNTTSGIGKVYVSGTERSSGTANLSTITGISKFRHYGKTVGLQSQVWLSQVLISTDPTVGGRLFTIPVVGAGATSSWIGDYTGVDEVVFSDADFLNSATAGQVTTCSVSAPSLSGYVVQAVIVTARGRCGASGPQNLQLALRVSGTDYFSASKALDVGYRAFCNVWETNPATSAAWNNSSIAALQPGVKSIA